MRSRGHVPAGWITWDPGVFFRPPYPFVCSQLAGGGGAQDSIFDAVALFCLVVLNVFEVIPIYDRSIYDTVLV